MAYNYEYPYTDPSRYNDDWLLNKMKELDALVQKLLEQYSSFEDLLARANAYTDAEVSKAKASIEENKRAILNLSEELQLSEAQLEDLIGITREELEAEIDTKYTRNSQRISQQWEDMKDYIANQVIEVKVRNFFTGARVSIQSMFDYLAGLHLSDAGTYAQISGQNTYDHFASKNETYTNVVLSSLTFFQS